MIGIQRDSVEQERGRQQLDDQSFGNCIEDILIFFYYVESLVVKICLI